LDPEAGAAQGCRDAPNDESWIGLARVRRDPDLWPLGLGRQETTIAEKLRQYDVAHAESQRGQINAAKRREAGIVPPPPADRSELALRVEQLEDNARVVGESPNDLEIDRHPVGDAEAIEECEVAPQLARERAHFGRVRELLLDVVQRHVAHEREQPVDRFV